ncbi:hypothetical protein C0J52_26753, partial [Blattella germanica]
MQWQDWLKHVDDKEMDVFLSKLFDLHKRKCFCVQRNYIHTRLNGFRWTVGLRYFLNPLAMGVMIFGTGYVKEEWRQYCLGGRKRRRFSSAT